MLVVGVWRRPGRGLGLCLVVQLLGGRPVDQPGYPAGVGLEALGWPAGGVERAVQGGGDGGGLFGPGGQEEEVAGGIEDERGQGDTPGRAAGIIGGDGQGGGAGWVSEGEAE